MEKSKNKLIYPENAYYDIFGETNNMPLDAEKTFEYIMETLSPREAHIFMLKYKEKMTYSKIGEIYGGLSGERIRKIIAEISDKLRSPVRREVLVMGLESHSSSVVPKQNAGNKNYQDKLNDLEKQFYLTHDVLNMGVDVLNFSARTFNCLTHAGFKTVKDIVYFDDFKKVRKLSQSGIQEIQNKLKLLQLKIAIIDDGINQNDFNLSDSWVINKDLSITDNLKPKTKSHGTTCAKIIHKYLKKELIANIRFHSIAILDSGTMKGNVSQLIAAFELCSKLNVKVIHMSIGSSYYKDFPAIQKSVEELSQKGVVIVAAQSNEGTVTYPACLPCVIGVKSDASLKDSQFRYFTDPCDNIDIAASSSHILENGMDKYITPPANSYAAPLVTGKVVSYLLENPNLTFGDIHNALKKDAMEISEKADIYFDYDGGENIKIPVVLFEGFELRELCEAMQKLREMFLDNDYNCRTALDVSRAELPDFDFVPNSLEILRYTCHFWLCDILLIGITDNEPSDCLDYFDEISIIVKNDAARDENTVKEIGDRVEIYSKDKNIDWIFDVILQTLT